MIKKLIIIDGFLHKIDEEYYEVRGTLFMLLPVLAFIT